MISLDLLSRFRTQLMGIAIIGIILFHSTFPFEYYSLMGFIFHNGYAGVEIFFLVSGFGIYYSISKSTSIKKFYKKRVLRILPYYLPIVVLYSFMTIYVNYWTVRDLVYNILMLGFWLNHGFGHIFDWYVPAILFMYLITPFFYNLYKRNKVATMIVFCAFPILLILSSEFWKIIDIQYLYLLLYRLPLYFIGFAIADFLKQHKNYKFSLPWIIVFVITFFVPLSVIVHLYFNTENWIAFSKHGREMVLCFFMVFPFCIFMCYFLSLFKNYKYPILSFLGTYTLTIYIFHERILRINQFWLNNYIQNNNLYIILFNIGVICITLFLSVFWQKAIDNLITKFENRNLQISERNIS